MSFDLSLGGNERKILQKFKKVRTKFGNNLIFEKNFVEIEVCALIKNFEDNLASSENIVKV